MAKESTTTVEVQSSPHTARASGGGNVDKILIEGKTFWDFDPSDDLAPILKSQMSSPRQRLSNAPPAARPLKKLDQDDTEKKVVGAVSQIYGYMSVDHMRYGVLATFHKFFFLRCSDCNMLEITKVIRRDQIQDTHSFTLMEAWLSLVMAAEDNHFFASPYPSPVLKYKNLGINPKNRMKVVETAKIGNLYFGDRITRGQLGSVVKRGILGEDETNSVMKIVDASKSSQMTQKLKDEMYAYRVLDNLQGKIVPKVRGVLLVHGWVRVLVLSNSGRGSKQQGVSGALR